MKIYRLIVGLCVLYVGFANSKVSAASVNSGAGVSEIRAESNGVWLYIDGVKTPAIAGTVYQNTEGNNHIRTYEYGHNLSALYSALDDREAGGQGHGARLQKMGIQAIRVYELPVDSTEDIQRTKDIFRRLFGKYHIKVLIGDWAGLNTGMDFDNEHDRSPLYTHLQKLVSTYSGESWVLGWQLGNENNYHIRNGILGHEIAMDAPQYYAFMDGLAGMMKEQLGRYQRMQFVSLGQGDLTDNEARLIGGMTNIDAVGINCYRKDPADFDALISLANSKIRKPIYFAEIGRPADGAESETKQAEYIQNTCAAIFSEGAGCLHSGKVLGVFLHEATDEAWKRTEHGKDEDAHYGILGKTSESRIGNYLNQYRDFCTYIVPTNDAPDTLVRSAWQCIDGPYARKYSSIYGHAMAYAGRAVYLYQGKAQEQQKHLLDMKSPPERAGAPDFWALNTVGTSYFIIADAWMLQSYNYKGSERPEMSWNRVLEMSDFDQSQTKPPMEYKTALPPTNAAICVFYARQVYNFMRQQYPDAHLRTAEGAYVRLDHVMNSRFPELSQPYVPLSWQNLAIFVAGGLVLIIGFAAFSRWRASKKSVTTVSVMGPFTRFVFLAVLVCNLAALFWFVNWWFHPVRIKYYTVQPVMFIVLTAIEASGILFYFYIWHVLWNMRRPVFMPAQPGHRVAIVTTRVASEPVDALEATLEKMAAITYPHDSYLLDEEDNPIAKAACERCGVIHFSRKGKPQYNEPAGKFQARTKGGNLNSWLYEFGQKYEYVTFLDPDHAPHAEFLDRVLGYFANQNVAFVQAPQVFYNRSANWIARGASEQSYFMYGPIQMGLFGIGACVVNGSHSTFRVSDLMSLKDQAYGVHDADDILTSMRIHARKKVGVYVPEVLAEGLAPETWDEFYKQQRRWAYSMFHIFFHKYASEQWGMPWRCKLVYLLFSSFYFRQIAFIGLLLLPFISAFTGNPPVNANLVAFCFRFLPFFVLQCTILVLLGQRFLIPGGSQKGFWYRGGLLWIALWWENICALKKAIFTRRVTDRVVAAKWKAGAVSPLRSIRAHIVLALAAAGAFAWTCMRSDRRETVWGTLIFLGLIALSQAYIIYQVINASPKSRPEPAPEPRPLAIPTYQGNLPKT